MEQVRVALAWIAKYHFWLLAALAVLLSTLVWYLAAGDLAERKEDNLAEINSAFQGQQQVKSRAYHANDAVNQRQRAQNVALANETKDIWQELYDRQRQEVLKWPSQLPQSFHDRVENKQFGDELDQLRREQYGDYIRGRFKDLPKIIDANEIDEDTAAAGGGGFSRGGRGGEFGSGGIGGFGNRQQEFDDQGNPIEVDYTVYWSEEDQARIRAELDWPTTQSYWRVWVTQEDLWVYETMLRAIAATNEAKGADRQSNAAITDIAALQVGRDAASESRTSGRIKRLQSATSLTGDGEDFSRDFASRDSAAPMDDGSGAMDEFGGRGGFDGSGGDNLGPAAEKALRLSGRYINAEGAPIQVTADEQPLAPDTFGQEMKRLPVRLVLRMDTRWLTTLITELANADLQIKVTEVRVNPQESNSGGGRGDFGGGGRSFGGRGGFGGGFGNEELLIFDRKPYMKPVVIQGVVLIFNPPNEEILNVGDGEASPDDFASL